MKLFIKNMVSNLCKGIVKLEIEKIIFESCNVELGWVELEKDITALQYAELKTALLIHGLELITDKKTILIEKIKTVIVEMVHYSDELPKTKFSCHLSQTLHYDYTYMANLFSEVTGITIEHYIIAHRIETVKELLLYNELNLTQISYKLNYSSVGHLSNQFKKFTGLTPTSFKKLEIQIRCDLDNVVPLYNLTG